MASGDLFLQPGDIPAGGVRVADLEGCLLVVVSLGDEIEMETSLGVGQARPVKVLVVDGAPALSGQWHETLFWQSALRGQMAAAAVQGKPMVGVMGKGEAQKGKSAPWKLLDPTPPQVEQCRSAYVKMEAGF